MNIKSMLLAIVPIFIGIVFTVGGIWLTGFGIEEAIYSNVDTTRGVKVGDIYVATYQGFPNNKYLSSEPSVSLLKILEIEEKSVLTETRNLDIDGATYVVKVWQDKEHIESLKKLK